MVARHVGPAPTSSRRSGRLLLALAAALAMGFAVLIAPASEATPPGSPQCNATGGSIAKAGTTFVHTFTASGTFTPEQAMTITYLVVGGGGGGGGSITATVGGGGTISARGNGVGGEGGAGTSTSVITGSAVRYGADRSAAAGAAGTGGTGTGGSSTVAPLAGAANTGDGGGGAGTLTGAGTVGGSGVVAIAYTLNAGCPGQPTSPIFNSPTFTWVAPTPPGAQTISSYTVIYKQTGQSTFGNIYAKSTSGSPLTINVVGNTQGECATNNPSDWTCNASISLVSGQTYEFQVFARTNTNALSKTSTAVSAAIA